MINVHLIVDGTFYLLFEEVENENERKDRKDMTRDTGVRTKIERRSKTS